LRKDSLSLATPAAVRTFALTRLDRLEVRVRRSRARGAARGAGLGALAGFAMGLAAATVANAQCRPGDDMCGLAFIGGPTLGVAAGLTLGAVVGAVHPGDRWQRVRRER
jgi:hypothetical protein